MRRRRSQLSCVGGLLVALLLGAFLTVGRGLAQPVEPRDPVDVSTLGPQVGQGVPDFELKDQHGEIRTLQSIMGPKGAVLLFHRSADW